jgi:CRP-like cAMP-binding protein
MHLIINQAGIQNRLLAALSPADFVLLQLSLTPRSVGLGQPLIRAGEPITSIYFPASGLASFVSDTELPTEVGIVGYEGFVGTSVVLGVEQVPLNAHGQIAGEGYAIPTSALLAAMEQSWTLRSVVARYTHVFMIQAASTVYANSAFTIEQRLARWLLMCHDRSRDDELLLTHEFLAVMLCVRRPGVTVATHVLEGIGAIRAKRGLIIIRDRAKLIDITGDSYGVAEAEYERVFSREAESARPRAAEAS